MSKIYFHLPGLFEFFPFYQKFLLMHASHKEKFYDDCEIGSIYGAPVGALWNGGRAVYMHSYVPNKTVKLFMEKYNVPCSLTFSNSLLNESHLSDTYCNITLRDFYNDTNSIIINSECLEQYIREHFPNYKLISSTTKCLNNNIDSINELSKDYERVVLNFNFNNNFSFLSSLTNQNKCEILVNPTCQPNCPRNIEHYKEVSQSILNAQPSSIRCPYPTQLFYQAMKSPLFISRSVLNDIYVPMGFKHFKIESRTTTEQNLLEILLYYLVKPEYQLELRQQFQHRDLFLKKG